MSARHWNDSLPLPSRPGKDARFDFLFNVRQKQRPGTGHVRICVQDSQNAHCLPKPQHPQKCKALSPEIVWETPAIVGIRRTAQLRLDIFSNPWIPPFSVYGKSFRVGRYSSVLVTRYDQKMPELIDLVKDNECFSFPFCPTFWGRLLDAPAFRFAENGC